MGYEDRSTQQYSRCTLPSLPPRHERKCIASQRESCVHLGSSSARISLDNLGNYMGPGMYRIELSPGEETVFRSIEELAVAIKRGVVTPRAHIYHSATNRWLPIQFHPHYKTALSMPLTQAALIAGPPVKPLSSLRLQQPAEPQPLAPVPAPIQATAAEQPAQRKSSRSESSKGTKRSRRSGKPRRQLRIALVGALLVGGAQWVLSAPLFSRADAPVLLRLQRQLISAPTEAMQRVSLPNTAAMISVIPESAMRSKPPARIEPLDQPHRSHVPSFGGNAPAVVDGADEIAPPPAASEVAASPFPSTDSISVPTVDSTKTKALKGIMRSVSGARPPGKTPPTR